MTFPSPLPPAAAALPSHLRGPYKSTKMHMTAKDWARLRDPDGNSIVQHRFGDVVAVVFGEDDDMEAERARLITAMPAMFHALVDLANRAENFAHSHTMIANGKGHVEETELRYSIDRARAALALARSPDPRSAPAIAQHAGGRDADPR